MPCNDVAEIIEVVLGPDDRLKSYTYNKRTCGQGVGAGDLLLEALRGRSAEWLLEVDAPAFLEAYPVDEPLEEFLQFKHVFAIQAAMEVLFGKAPGGPGDACLAADVSYDVDSGDTRIIGEIPVDLLTEKIRSCGGCKGCGKSKKMVFV